MARFNMDDYETVEERLAKFWEDCPEGRILTEVLKLEGSFVCIRAEVWKDKTIDRPDASGIAYEDSEKGGNPVNKTSHIENCETSAIGRALANLGYAGKKRPSREEMEKVDRYEQAAKQINDIPGMDDPDREQVEQLIQALKEQGKWQDSMKGEAHRSALAKKLKPGTPAYYQHVAGCLAENLG
jgi:hypothetical protein